MGNFTHENLHQAAERVPGGILGGVTEDRDQTLAGEVELICISLEAFWRFPEDGMLEPSPAASAAPTLKFVDSNG
jgi:hypothetical protein